MMDDQKHIIKTINYYSGLKRPRLGSSYIKKGGTPLDKLKPTMSKTT